MKYNHFYRNHCKINFGSGDFQLLRGVTHRQTDTQTDAGKNNNRFATNIDDAQNNAKLITVSRSAMSQNDPTASVLPIISEAAE